MSKSQDEWVKIGQSLRSGVLKRVEDFNKSSITNPDDLRTLILSVCDALEIDILANAFDRAVLARVTDPKERWEEGD